MANLLALVEQLKKERDRVQQQLSGLNTALATFSGAYSNGHQPRRTISAKGRANIIAAQRARWAKLRRKHEVSIPIKGTMSASTRRKIAAAQKARWANLKGKKKAA